MLHYNNIFSSILLIVLALLFNSTSCDDTEIPGFVPLGTNYTTTDISVVICPQYGESVPQQDECHIMNIKPKSSESITIPYPDKIFEDGGTLLFLVFDSYTFNNTDFSTLIEENLQLAKHSMSETQFRTWNGRFEISQYNDKYTLLFYKH